MVGMPLVLTFRGLGDGAGGRRYRGAVSSGMSLLRGDALSAQEGDWGCPTRTRWVPGAVPSPPALVSPLLCLGLRL